MQQLDIYMGQARGSPLGFVGELNLSASMTAKRDERNDSFIKQLKSEQKNNLL